jgi:predicted NBD/HSP70 family sugar kinase
MTSLPLSRIANRSAVLACLLSGAGIDRRQLVIRSGVSQATVSRVVEELIESGIAEERDVVSSGLRGRPSTTVGLNPRAALVAGVDLGGTNCRIVVADALGRAIARSRRATPRDLPGVDIAHWIADEVKRLVADAGDGAPLRSLVVGVPGAIDGRKQTIVGAHNLPQLVGTEFAETLSTTIEAPTSIDNDSNLALLGELQYGELPEHDTTVLFALGTGLGAAISLEGKIVSGRMGLLGEFGRLILPGGTTRVRDLVSGAGLLALARERGYQIDSAAELFADPMRFDAILSEMRAALRHLAAIVALAYEPQHVVFTGGFSDSLDQDLFDVLSADVAASTGVSTSIQRSVLGDWAGLLGAVASALSVLYRQLGVEPQHLGLIEADRAAVIDRLQISRN